MTLALDINECESSPCVQGYCTDQVNGYLCECIPGFIGVSCAIGKKFMNYHGIDGDSKFLNKKITTSICVGFFFGRYR